MHFWAFRLQDQKWRTLKIKELSLWGAFSFSSDKCLVFGKERFFPCVFHSVICSTYFAMYILVSRSAIWLAVRSRKKNGGLQKYGWAEFCRCTKFDWTSRPTKMEEKITNGCPSEGGLSQHTSSNIIYLNYSVFGIFCVLTIPPWPH